MSFIEAELRIEQNLLRGTGWLNLSNLQLQNIPSSIGKLTHLTELSLSNNIFTSIPEEIFSLKNLKKLYLNGNQINEISSGVVALSSLISLQISRNKLEKLIPEIAELHSLIFLDVSKNKLVSLPKSLNELNALLDLNCSHNFIESLPDNYSALSEILTLNMQGNRLNDYPDAINNLYRLQELNLSGNKISRLPESISQLQNLVKLDLSANKLESLPESICELSRLNSLNLSRNRLHQLPLNIGNLKNLAELDLLDNEVRELPDSIQYLDKKLILDIDKYKMERPPAEIVSRGIESIRSYFDQIETQGEEYLYEAKLIIVGDPGAGKTTLYKKLLNPSYSAPDAQCRSTLGINIDTWNFIGQDKKGQTRLFRVNLWDFGGQEIQYMTHQFFLTSRSIYVLVSDDRAQRNNFNYWFGVIDGFGKNSPVMVLLNEMSHNTITNFYAADYIENYPNLLKIHKDIDFSIEDGRFENLTQTLKTSIQSLGHIGDPLPKQWISIRKTLEKLQANHYYIPFETYQKICGECGLRNDSQQLTLSEYLHDLGVIVHFQRDKDISHYIVLNPQWLVDAIYKVVSDRNVYSNSGQFSKEWLQKKWSEYKLPERNFLLSLMLKNRFDICYAVDKDANNFIVPQLLPPERPEIDVSLKQGLKIRYLYKNLPHGLLSRLIVRLSDNIERKTVPIIWKYGAVLNHENSRALIEERTIKNGSKVIDVHVDGFSIGSSDFISKIRCELENIQQTWYKNIYYQALVPCNGCLDQEIDDPKYIPLEELDMFLQKEVNSVPCGICGEFYHPSKLLFGIYPKHASSNPNSIHYYIYNPEHITETTMTNIKFGDNASIGGDITAVNARNISDSFNKNYGNAADGMKQAYSELQIQINKLIEKLPEKQDEIKKDFEILQKEISAKTPNKRFFDFSAEGLLDAAKFIQELAEPIKNTLKTISELIWNPVP